GYGPSSAGAPSGGGGSGAAGSCAGRVSLSWPALAGAPQASIPIATNGNTGIFMRLFLSVAAVAGAWRARQLTTKGCARNSRTQGEAPGFFRNDARPPRCYARARKGRRLAGRLFAQDDLRDLRPAVVTHRLLAGQAATDVQDGRRQVKRATIEATAVAAGHEHRAQQGQADLPPVNVSCQHQVDPLLL